VSDFLFSARPRPAGELRAHLERFLAPAGVEVRELHGAWGSLAVAAAPHDPPPVHQEGGWTTVLAGEPLLRSATLGTGVVDTPPRRAELHRLLAAPDAWDERLDGQFAALAIGDAGGGRVLTDAFAFVPVFHGDGGGALVLGTHVDAVARACGRAGDVDPVSAADLVANLTCTHPHTLYRGVWQLDAGADRRFGADGWAGEGRHWWAPREEPLFARLEDAAAALREGVLGYVAAVCGGAERVGLLMSGGEDSRAVLGAVPRGVEVDAVVYAEWESREVRVARAASACYGAALRVGVRAPTHYADGFRDVAALVGSNHLFADVHGYGLHRSLGLGALPRVLGGLSSDSLLKATYARDRHGAPVEVPSAPSVRPELLREVAARRTAFRDRLAHLRPRTADEWDTLWPFSMRKHGGNVDGNRRLFRSHEAYHALAVLRVAAAAPVAWKAHRRLFLAAMRPLLRPSWHVPHAEYRFPYFGRVGNAALLPVLGAARAVRAVATGEVRARHRPWPKWSRLAAAVAAQIPAGELAASPLGPVFAAPDPAALESSLGAEYALRRLIAAQLAHVTALAAGG
jgi:hypothetical protein